MERPKLGLTPEADLPDLHPPTKKCTVNLAILKLNGVKVAHPHARSYIPRLTLAPVSYTHLRAHETLMNL
eukprot:61446-Prymnesium_polylepis.1